MNVRLHPYICQRGFTSDKFMLLIASFHAEEISVYTQLRTTFQAFR